MPFNYDYYRIFYFVAKCRSFTRAAKIMLSNQPNITRSMNNLEQELGCRLFVRSNRGVTLTPEGKKLFAHVATAFAQLEAGEAELANDKSLLSGAVSIGANETALHGILLSKLRKLHQTHPGFRIRLSNYSTPQAVLALKNGLLDLAVVTTPTGVRKPLREIALKPFLEILVGGPDFSFLAGKALRLKDLQEYPLVCLAADTKTFEFYDRLFLEHGLTLHPDMEAATTDQVLPMVKSGLGIGFIPKDLATEALERKEVFQIRLEEPIPERNICLVKDTGRPLSIAAKELEKLLRQA
ncbi:MAG: LysR family transcriptional regulator [Intestinimonas sp.]|nr:LysR family transcriptional regulator [Intestinimonas sp.]